jgi:anti-sigma regulatory factor (Ser/Thr protein kinase)
VTTITDRGRGLPDVTIGLAPVGSDRQDGRGLWIATQVCDHLSVSKSDDEFLIRLVKGKTNPDA